MVRVVFPFHPGWLMTTYSSYILEPIIIFQESLEESQFFHWQDEVRHREGLNGT